MKVKIKVLLVSTEPCCFNNGVSCSKSKIKLRSCVLLCFNYLFDRPCVMAGILVAWQNKGRNLVF